ncbi:sigma-54 interaction domain-containing protein [Thermoanaerobacter uzonensis]|uniref:sigma-54 interaction domain-containing protein n=1 Tax=Thermoanaerobacter uzonensis TaxID=447593 RepID=UPI003D76703C
MKSIGIVTEGHSSLGEFLAENLREVFLDSIKINNYYFKRLKKGDIIEDDVVLVMIKEKALQIQGYVKDSQKIIVIERTVKDGQIHNILTIPPNTNVLVVNDTIETTLETISLLYQIGINHIRLEPYDPEKEYKDIKIAITPGEKNRVPSYIEKVIDIGNRCIDISTFIKIISMLNINNKEISDRLLKYSDTIIPLNRGIKNQYKEMITKNERLNTIINLLNEGILYINDQGVIELYNKAFSKMFKLNKDIIGRSMEEIFDNKVFTFLENVSSKDELIEYQGQYINVKKITSEYLGRKIGYCFNFQEVTYIKQLEENLRQKLAKKGYVAKYTFDNIKTCSQSMKECIMTAKKIADSDLTVLIIGESGTGKELFAQSIHNASRRRNQPFVAINCAAVPESLLESELFGYEGGAFTGALKEGKAGLFEQAHNGTIFLDEIGDMPLSLQARLLRVIQERQVMRIGSQKVIDVNIRIIAATNKNLFELVQKGLFREDLYYRLNVLPIYIPPLRNRKEDIIPLLKEFLEGNKKLNFTKEAEDILINYDWPGNVRELQNTASYIAIMCEHTVTPEDLPLYLLNTDNFDYYIVRLQSTVNISKAIEILKIIKDSNLISKGIGRNGIAKILALKGIFITEGEVRTILSVLNELKLINSNIGRKGSELTIAGQRFLNWYENRRKHKPN